DIFRTVLSVAENTNAGDEAAVKQFFMKKTEQIPAGWRESLEKAEKHGDEKKMHIEQIKLKAAQEIRDKFCAIWEA
ncbi:MAG: hypothetical protein IJP17_01635, partial [Clostridia bacterium]|nr:hypothetical protein [Clostridia bacterium]